MILICVNSTYQKLFQMHLILLLFLSAIAIYTVETASTPAPDNSCDKLYNTVEQNIPSPLTTYSITTNKANNMNITWILKTTRTSSIYFVRVKFSMDLEDGKDVFKVYERSSLLKSYSTKLENQELLLPITPFHYQFHLKTACSSSPSSTASRTSISIILETIKQISPIQCSQLYPGFNCSFMACSSGYEPHPERPFVCNRCLPGYFKTARNNEACSICPVGTISTPDKSKCLDCPAGTEANDNQSECTKCKDGFFRPVYSAYCIPCVLGATCGPTTFACKPGWTVTNDGKSCVDAGLNVGSTEEIVIIIAVSGVVATACLLIFYMIVKYRSINKFNRSTSCITMADIQMYQEHAPHLSTEKLPDLRRKPSGKSPKSGVKSIPKTATDSKTRLTDAPGLTLNLDDETPMNSTGNLSRSSTKSKSKSRIDGSPKLPKSKSMINNAIDSPEIAAAPPVLLSKSRSKLRMHDDIGTQLVERNTVFIDTEILQVPPSTIKSKSIRMLNGNEPTGAIIKSQSKSRLDDSPETSSGVELPKSKSKSRLNNGTETVSDIDPSSIKPTVTRSKSKLRVNNSPEAELARSNSKILLNDGAELFSNSGMSRSKSMTRLNNGSESPALLVRSKSKSRGNNIGTGTLTKSPETNNMPPPLPKSQSYSSWANKESE